MTESDAYIALNMVPNAGGATVRAAVARFGSAAAVLTAGAGALAQVRGIGRARASELADAATAVDWRGERARAASSRIALVAQCDADFPAKLATLASPPLALYVAGDVGCLSGPCVAIVGTRSPTLYGREQARSFGYRLALAGWTVVSGLARGVDTEAAEGALLARGRTVAVIGSALDRLYPPENRELARRIVAAGGAVISEYPFGRTADRQTFPMRNRIISGLSRGVVCIEGGVTSGTLITADHAMEQGRSVMALPGRVTDPSALGCLKLIQQGARLVTCPDEVLDELSSLPPQVGEAQGAMPPPAATPQPPLPQRRHPQLPPPPRPRAAPSPSSAAPTSPAPSPRTATSLSPDERKVVDALSKHGELTPDEISAYSAVPARTLAPLLMALEMKSVAKRRPDGLFELRKGVS